MPAEAGSAGPGPVEPTAVQVRRVRPEDWPLLRSLRLEALADTPIAYLETLAAAEQLGAGTWRARAARGAEGGDSFQVLALLGGRPVATCVCFLDAAERTRAWLAAVYVAPAHRGAGLLDRLVEPCAVWAHAQGRAELVLEVHETNARARTAYGRLGFTETGTTVPYPLDPGGLELIMARSLVDPQAAQGTAPCPVRSG